MKIHFALTLFLITLVGCDSESLDHKVITSVFEDGIALSWNEDAEEKSWAYEIADPAPYGNQANYALYLYDGHKKHFIEASTSRKNLPIKSNWTSNDEYTTKIRNGVCHLWMDYELYSSEGILLLKGTKLSEPSANHPKIKN